MITKLKRIIDLVRNMGWRWAAFRAKHELLRRTGLLKKRFPADPPFHRYITLDEWRKSTHRFFFHSRDTLTIPRRPDEGLAVAFRHLEQGKLLLFNSVLADLGPDHDWVTNPDNGYRYDVSKHWTEIPDYSATAGDIKYVWERSRFSYLYDIIRYDHHFGEDHSQMVFDDMLSWIGSNPVNRGPNYRCSQEMSLRVLNWTFALHFYRHSPALTEEVFDQVQHTIYWHLHHIYHNIDFSRIAVRNNHAITETLTLYLGGLLYPSLPGAAVWKERGKAWFEEEVAYQVYKDGTFLQFSMNYHRVVVQLLTWGIVLADKNGERFADVVYDRARNSVRFLRTCMVDENGWLPNYGANDGALFFKLSNAHYRDYRSQLHALAAALGLDAGIDGSHEDRSWYGIDKLTTQQWHPGNGLHSFYWGGYYIIREPHTLTFIRCGNHKDRPSQADNLHIDVWHNGENILTDAGSYKYNTDAATIRYFSGTRSHNTVMVDDNDQMLKGGRFIWYHWTQSRGVEMTEDAGSYKFTGRISAFRHLHKRIRHQRTIVKEKGRPYWTVTDELLCVPAKMSMRQLWHVPLPLTHKVRIRAEGDDGVAMLPAKYDGWSSSLYGAKEPTDEYCFTTAGRVIKTVVEL
ncbi:hypothetical protein GCM10023093_25420 [Nemorincola caseinilytica]|uniref:Heparinase n=1 Tax=Nemorincola caseinilytica TaxID=2054315 RepID=A0ABP8NJ66_9BACT